MASWAPDVTPDTKPVKRHRADTAEWKEIRARFADACCVACGLGDNLELHHICPRSQSGDDVVENLCVLCRVCHGKLEGHEDGWERIAAAVRVYVLLNRPRCVYVIGKIGWERFNARYPLLSESGVAASASADDQRQAGTAGTPPQDGSSFAARSLHAPDSESDDKPRVGAWDLEWLPEFHEEDIPFA